MTVTYSSLEQKVSENMGDRLSLTTSSAGNAGGTTIVCTALADEDFGGDDEAFNGFWLRCESGTNNGEVRRVKRTSGYTASSTTLTVSRAFTGQVASGVSITLHRYDPRIKLRATQRALNHVFNNVFVPRTDETLVVDNRLSNADFEDTAGAGTFDNWTEVGSLTVTIETTNVRHGTNAAKVVAGVSAGQLTQAPTLNVSALIGKSVTLKMWVWTASASAARLRLDWNGSDFENGSYHTGDSTWRLLYVTGTVPSNATQVKAILETAATKTAYFDAGWMTVDILTEYTVPSTIIRGPMFVQQQDNEDEPNGRYLNITHPMAGSRLRLIGMGLPTVPTALSDSVELDSLAADVVGYVGAGFTYDLLASHAALDEAPEFAGAARAWMNKAEQLLNNGALTQRLGAARASHTWHVVDNAGTRKLVFPQRRLSNVDIA